MVRLRNASFASKHPSLIGERLMCHQNTRSNSTSKWDISRFAVFTFLVAILRLLWVSRSPLTLNIAGPLSMVHGDLCAYNEASGLGNFLRNAWEEYLWPIQITSQELHLYCPCLIRLFPFYSKANGMLLLTQAWVEQFFWCTTVVAYVLQWNMRNLPSISSPSAPCYYKLSNKLLALAMDAMAAMMDHSPADRVKSTGRYTECVMNNIRNS